MKRIKKLLTLIPLLLLFSFGGCSCGKDTPPQENSEDAYAQYNEMVAQDFSSFTLKITTQNDGTILNGQYSVRPCDEGTHITYSYQKVNEIIQDGEVLIFPDEYISTLQGEMVVNGNVILSQNGAEINLPFDKISSIGLEFDESFFENVTKTDKSFSATVVNPSGYLCQTINCTQMTTTLRFIENTLMKIEISYLSEKGTTVQIEYSF